MAQILVISQDRTRAIYLSHILEQAGYTVSLADEATSSAMLSNGDVNAVVVHLHRPGTESLSQVATLRHSFPHVSIIAIASEKHPINFLTLRITGADDVLRYPLSPPSLLDAVQRAIEEPP